MPDTAKRLYGPALQSASATTRYTVPASTTTIIKQIIVANTSATAATVTLSIGADAAATRVLPAVTVAANSVFVFDCWLVMAATETLQAYSGTASVLTLTLNGIEVS